jgi:hypothetical protein
MIAGRIAELKVFCLSRLTALFQEVTAICVDIRVVSWEGLSFRTELLYRINSSHPAL